MSFSPDRPLRLSGAETRWDILGSVVSRSTCEDRKVEGPRLRAPRPRVRAGDGSLQAIGGVECGAAPWDNEADGREAHGRVKVRDILKMLEDEGWSLVRQHGSHRQFTHDKKTGLVTVAGKPGDDVAPGTLNSILKQAGVKP